MVIWRINEPRGGPSGVHFGDLEQGSAWSLPGTTNNFVSTQHYSRSCDCKELWITSASLNQSFVVDSVISVLSSGSVRPHYGLFIYLFIKKTLSYWFKLSVIGLISSILSVCFSTESLSVRFQFLEATRKWSRISMLDCDWNSFENVRSLEFLHWGLFDSST